MKQATKDEVLRALPFFNKKELTDVHKVTELLLGKVSGSFTEEETELYDVICLATNSTVPVTAFRATVTASEWRNKAPLALNFIRDAFPDTKRNKALRVAMMKFTLAMLVADLKARGVPIKTGSVVLNLGRLRECFGANFPGYLEAGLAHVIIEKMQSHT